MKLSKVKAQLREEQLADIEVTSPEEFLGKSDVEQWRHCAARDLKAALRVEQLGGDGEWFRQRAAWYLEAAAKTERGEAIED